MNQQTSSNDALLINLPHMFFSAMQHWRRILILVVIGALLGGSFGLLKSTKQASFVPNQQSLDKMQQAIIDLEEYRDLLDYTKNSILYQQNDNNFYQAHITCYVDAGSDWENVVQYYLQNLSSALLPEFCALLGSDLDPQYIQELLTINVYPAAYQARSEGNPYYLTPSTAIWVELYAYHPSQALCQDMMNIMMQYLVELNTTSEGQFENFTSGGIQQTMQYVYDSNNATRQASIRQNLQNLQKKSNDSQASFSGNELAYYREHFLQGGPQNQPVKTALKYGILASALILIFWCIFFFLFYLADPTIQTITELGKISVWGKVMDKTSKKLGFWSRKQTEYLGCSDDWDAVAQLIASIPGKVTLISETTDSPFLDFLAGKCSNVTITRYMNQDAQAVLSAKEAGQALLAVKLCQSGKQNLNHQLELMRNLDITMLGAIVIA